MAGLGVAFLYIHVAGNGFMKHVATVAVGICVALHGTSVCGSPSNPCAPVL